MRISRHQDIAILLMSELGKSYSTRLVPLSEVAMRHGVSVLYLKKLARFLKKARLIDSKEGAGGGYMLTKHPGLINVWDIVSALEGHPQRLPRAITDRDHCPLVHSCLPQAIRNTIEEAFARSFRGIPLSSLSAGNTYETQTQGN